MQPISHLTCIEKIPVSYQRLTEPPWHLLNTRHFAEDAASHPRVSGFAPSCFGSHEVHREGDLCQSSAAYALLAETACAHQESATTTPAAKWT
jgi:hypothetical protein